MSIDPIPEGHHTVTPYFLVKNADRFMQFLKATFGGKQIAPLEGQFYGDRSGAVQDPEGNKWWIASRREIVSPEEIANRMAKKN